MSTRLSLKPGLWDLPEGLDPSASYGNLWRRLQPVMVLEPVRTETVLEGPHDELSPVENRLLGAMTHVNRRSEWLAGRRAAKQATLPLISQNQENALPPALIEILPDSQGRPHLAARPEIGLSISHSVEASRGWAIAAAYRSQHGVMGVDLQAHRPLSQKLIDRVGSPEEQSEYERLCREVPEMSTEYFYRLWTLKEAAWKLCSAAALPLPSFDELHWTATGSPQTWATRWKGCLISGICLELSDAEMSYSLALALCLPCR